MDKQLFSAVKDPIGVIGKESRKRGTGRGAAVKGAEAACIKR